MLPIVLIMFHVPFSVFLGHAHMPAEMYPISKKKKKQNMERKLNFVTFGFKAQAG